MKKIIALLLLITSLFVLVSCGEKEYEPVESSAVEAQVVMTIKFEEKKYDVKYELYRALFLNLRESVDGGDASVWSGDNKADYVAKIDGIIRARITEIYSVLHIANKIGIDVYSSEFDKAVKEYIKASVEGGYYDEIKIEGFGGDYQKYLDSLKQANLNYSVQDLLLRYSLATEKIYEYYAGYLDGEYIEETVQGKLEYTREDVLAFYNSNECVRVMRAFLPKAYFSATRAAEIRDKIVEKASFGDEEVGNYIIGISSTASSDVKNGELIAKHNLDTAYYEELEEAAFELAYFEVSEVISVTTGYEDGYVILYKIVKNDSHFDSCYDYITSVYVQNEIGKIIDMAAASMLEAIETTSVLEALDYAGISMQ